MHDTVEDNGRTYVIKLREGLKFHNGEPVRAQDAIQSLKRWAGRETFGQTVAKFVEDWGVANDRTLRMFGFVDVGNVWAADEKFGSDLRASVGIGLSWISPVGPLRFAWANPVRTQDGDKIQKFQFQIGTSF